MKGRAEALHQEVGGTRVPEHPNSQALEAAHRVWCRRDGWGGGVERGCSSPTRPHLVLGLGSKQPGPGKSGDRDLRISNLSRHRKGARKG